MPSVPDTSSLPWWLGPTKAPWEAMLAGVQSGSQIRSNNLRAMQMAAEMEQNVRREETATKLKLIDLGLEGDRNEIALKTFQAKHDADKMRITAMSDIGDYLGEATKNDKLTDPETQAGFWRLTSKYAPFIPETAVNSMWDNTFKSAMDRKESSKKFEAQQFNADRRAVEAERRLGIMQQRVDLASESDEHRRAIADARLSLDEAKSESTDENRSALLSIAERKLQMAESLSKDRAEIAKGNLEMRQKELAARAERHDLDVERLKSRLPEAKRMQFASELRALESNLKTGFDKSEKLDRNEPDSVTFNRKFKALSEKYDPEPDSGRSAPINPTDRKAGSVYDTPRGKLKWTGTGWVTP